MLIRLVKLGTSTQASRKQDGEDRQHAVLIPDAGQLQAGPVARRGALAAWPTEVVVVVVFLLKIPGAISLRVSGRSTGRHGQIERLDLVGLVVGKLAGDLPSRMTMIRSAMPSTSGSSLETTTTAMPTLARS